jgi:hypothetical protein
MSKLLVYENVESDAFGGVWVSTGIAVRLEKTEFRAPVVRRVRAPRQHQCVRDPSK